MRAEAEMMPVGRLGGRPVIVRHITGRAESGSTSLQHLIGRQMLLCARRGGELSPVGAARRRHVQRALAVTRCGSRTI